MLKTIKRHPFKLIASLIPSDNKTSLQFYHDVRFLKTQSLWLYAIFHNDNLVYIGSTYAKKGIYHRLRLYCWPHYSQVTNSRINKFCLDNGKLDFYGWQLSSVSKRKCSRIENISLLLSKESYLIESLDPILNIR